jgi:hypothetical protein
MIQIKPILSDKYTCDCGGNFTFTELIWQGLHVCTKMVCDQCSNVEINSLPVNQSALETYSFLPESGLIKDISGQKVSENWFSSKLKTISTPLPDEVVMEVEILEVFDEVIILNTLDYVYGHSFLYLLNLQRLIATEKSYGIIVIIQPMLKWLVPEKGVAEIWTVNLGFKELNSYYPDLSEKINNQINRFKKVFLSQGHVIPTNKNIQIENFTGVKPFNFSNEPINPRITFIWREDHGRLWIRNIYLLKGFKILGIGKILIPLHYLRILLFFHLLRNRLGNSYKYTLAGFGKSCKWPQFIEDMRVNSFDEESEKGLCRFYAQSMLVIGIHGSSMLLPSAHAGMTVSMMPSKRWGNYAEDILFNENDIRLAYFQKRIVPLNMSIFDLRDIVIEMITGRNYYIKKFIHSDQL